MTKAIQTPTLDGEGTLDPAVLTAPKRRRWQVIVALAAIAAAAVAAWFILRNDAQTVSAVSTPVELDDVIVRDMTQIETLEGTLGFEVGDPLTSRVAGTLTYVPEPGAVLVEGDVLYAVDLQPVVLMYGNLPAFQTIARVPDTEDLTIRAGGTVTGVVSGGETIGHGSVVAEVDGSPVTAFIGDIPMYRTLSYNSRSPMEGPDIAQLEAILVDIGYDPDGWVVVDETFDWATGEMVEAWQEDIGAPVDGAVGVDEVVYLSEPVTVDQVFVVVGDLLQGAGRIATVYTSFDGTEGSDVAQLEAALDRLGFSPGVPDGTFGAAAETAVRQWQESVGAEVDGVIELGEVIFLPGPVRVAEVNLAIGDEVRSGNQVFAATSDSVAVAVDLDAADQDLLVEGLEVTVVLPNGTEAPGTVASVASVARRNAQSGAATFDVQIELDDVSVAAGLDEAPVDVEVITEERPAVMAVPVTALLALAEGGYGVEVDTGGGTTRLVGVEPGLYADGYVEVESTGLTLGDRVVVP